MNAAGRMLSGGVGWSLGSLASGAFAELVCTRAAMLVLVVFGVLAAVFARVSPLRQMADEPAVSGAGEAGVA